MFTLSFIGCIDKGQICEKHPANLSLAKEEISFHLNGFSFLDILL